MRTDLEQRAKEPIRRLMVAISKERVNVQLDVSLRRKGL